MTKLACIAFGLAIIALAPAALAADAPDAGLRDELLRMSRRRILFVHRSVGAGVLAGVGRLADRSGVDFQIVELRAAGPIGPATLGHVWVEEASDPRRKLARFGRALEDIEGPAPEIALFKLCFLEVGASTDVAALFDEYQSTFRELGRRYPHTTFVHVTVPLTTVQGGVKAAVKRLLGRAPGGYLENLRREEFNARLREAYRGGALFDLARLEATTRSGTTTTAEWQGRSFLALDPASTLDGGHPDPVAQDRIAHALVVHLAALP